MKSPRLQFQLNKTEADQFGELIDNPLMQKALVYALAELSTAVLDERTIAGANAFVGILTSLHVEQKLEQFPQRKLSTET